MEPNFSTEVETLEGATLIHVRGEIDIATCGRLRDVIEPHLGPAQRLVLDFSGVEFMDSSCLKVLVQARGALTADGGSLVLRNPSQIARRLPKLRNCKTCSTTTPEITRRQTDPTTEFPSKLVASACTNASPHRSAPTPTNRR